MKRIFIFIFLISLGFYGHAQKFTISGYIKDQSSGEALIGANIVNKTSNSVTSSNSQGFYSTTFKSDSILLVFSFVGYEPYKLNFLLDQDTMINVELMGKTLLKELVISAETIDPGSESSLMSAVSIKAEQISDFPALLGETDLLKALQMVPGVQSGNEGSAGIYVRGGGPDQNLILLDGVPIYNASHLFGFFSVFNSDALNKIHLIKGGFPARYGGRLSSVVDISLKEGNYKELKGRGSVGLISSKLTLEGPLKTDRTSFLVSARRTYMDALTGPLVKLFETESVVPRYFFYDLNLKIDHRISSRDKISFSSYAGKDKAFSRIDQPEDGTGNLAYREEYGIKWGNMTTALRWNRIIDKKLFSNLLMSYNNYVFDLFEEYEEYPLGQKSGYYKGEYISGITDLSLKADLEYLHDSDHQMYFGAHLTDHTFKPGAVHFKTLWEADTTWGSLNTKAVEFASYFENDHKIFDRLKLNYGLHYSGFLVDHKYYQSLQPRITGSFMLGRDFSFKASYADMTQYIHLLSNSGIGLPTDLWVPATSEIKPQRSRQLAAGFAKKALGVEFALEGFYKEMENLIEYKAGATFLHMDQNWQTKVISGKGDSYGMEFFAHKSSGMVTGMLGYTLSWANREFRNNFFGQEKTEKFPYRYDRRHDISIVTVTEIAEGIEFSWSWIFGSGSAITLPVSSHMSLYPDYSGGRNVLKVETENYIKRNGYRMRDYHRLDLGISFTKAIKWGQRSWHIGTFNTYNRSNPYFIDMGRDKNNYRKFIQRSLFPLIPSVSYSFKF